MMGLQVYLLGVFLALVILLCVLRIKYKEDGVITYGDVFLVILLMSTSYVAIITLCISFMFEYSNKPLFKKES